MINEKHLMRAAMLALAAGLAGVTYLHTHARADGAPTTAPLTYSGTLEEGGAPVTGTRNIRLTVWDDPTSIDSTRLRCTTVVTGASVTAGRFQVVLDNACTSVVRSTPNLWLEVEVNGGSLGRTKIGAVPFAIEAGRAAELTPAASRALIPPGTVVAYAGSTAPAGWLLCDGSAVSQTTYPALFAAIGSAHGTGGSSSNFNLPDYRGRFLRGVDGTAGRDPDASARIAAAAGGSTGNNVGSVQGAEFLAHNHGPAGAHSHLTGENQGSDPNGWGRGTAQGFAFSSYSGTVAVNYTSPAPNHTHATQGGSETRPVNAYVNYIIKY